MIAAAGRDGAGADTDAALETADVRPGVSLNDDLVTAPHHPPNPPRTAPRATPGESLNASTDSFPSTVLLSPTIPSHVRPRSSTIASFTSSVDDGESSDDSVLSWWSDSDEDSDDEGQGVDEEKEAERKRREEERLKMLSVAGLQLRREPPKPPVADGSEDVPARGGEAREKGGAKMRRAAPAAPKRRRRAPAVPVADEAAGGAGAGKNAGPGDGAAQHEQDTAAEKLDTQDAYARYEQFLAESRNRSAHAPSSVPVVAAPSPRPPPSTLPGSSGSRPSSAVFSDSTLSPTASVSMSGSASTGAGGAGGRLSGFFSKMMQNTGSGGAGESAHGNRPRRSTIISGPISRFDDSGRSTPLAGAGDASPGLGPGSGAADPELGKTWGSMVDTGILASMSDKERKRQEVSLASSCALCSAAQWTAQRACDDHSCLLADSLESMPWDAR